MVIREIIFGSFEFLGDWLLLLLRRVVYFLVVRLVLLLINLVIKVFIIVLFANMKCSLNFMDELSYFRLRYFRLFQDVWVFKVKLLGCLLGVWMQYQLLKQYCIYLLLFVGLLILVVNSNYRRLVAHT